MLSLVNRRLISPLLLTIVIFMFLLISFARASDENRVAIIVDYGDGEIETRCVAFSEETISGYEALERSGLTFETEFQAGSAAVCSIEGKGCSSDDCFCSCLGGGDCLYWSYWHQIDGDWRYSVAGSGLYRVNDGAVDGWVWGPGSVTQGSPPPLVTFEEVCTDSQSVAADGGNASLSTSGDKSLVKEQPPNYTGLGLLGLILGVLSLIILLRRKNHPGEQSDR